MPQIGDITRCRDLGLKGTGSRIWAICSICGVARWTQVRFGRPVARICKKCTRYIIGQRQKRENHPSWKGGRFKTGYGYILVRLFPDDFFYSMVEQNKYVFEHRLIMARHLGRCLLSWETVHHKNGIRDDNRLENLELFPSAMRHNGLTKMTRYIKKLEVENKQLREKLANLEIQLGGTNEPTLSNGVTQI